VGGQQAGEKYSGAKQGRNIPAFGIDDFLQKKSIHKN